MTHKTKLLALLLALAVTTSGCATVTTGEIGVYTGPQGKIQEAALQQGMYQDVIGNVSVYSTREVQILVTGLKPQTSDNSTLEDFDLTITYSVVPAAVPSLIAKYGERYNEFNEKTKEISPMAGYIRRFVIQATTVAVSKVPSLEVNKKITEVAEDIRQQLIESLKKEGLDSSIEITSVIGGDVRLPKVITDAQNLTVKAESELTAAKKKVETAQQEALKIRAISQNLTPEYLELQRIEAMKAAAANSKGWIIDGSKPNIMLPSK